MQTHINPIFTKNPVTHKLQIQEKIKAGQVTRALTELVRGIKFMKFTFVFKPLSNGLDRTI